LATKLLLKGINGFIKLLKDSIISGIIFGIPPESGALM